MIASSFTTWSEDICPRIIGTSNSATATMTSSGTANMLSPQSQFMFNSRVFYRAVVTSPVAIETLRIEKITILSGGRVPSQVLYDASYTGNPLSYFASLNSGTFAAQVSHADSVTAAPTLMQVSSRRRIYHDACWLLALELLL